ncbi:hypothetical protein COO91_09147 (plasmid) [Nostoc flagelliforme CCNUN1]|uniref:Uncharacterized protein n=1 Tax=Nostoc flagelliforme CCNUN1 TaxID=2038116 RepID=A0A2K8T5Q2_9NOSO|nr:hypothetical protein COO91_09147 [Nostoc flagelliforme CCNUN1]
MVEELELSFGSNLRTQTFRNISTKLLKIPEFLFFSGWAV